MSRASAWSRVTCHDGIVAVYQPGECPSRSCDGRCVLVPLLYMTPGVARALADELLRCSREAEQDDSAEPQRLNLEERLARIERALFGDKDICACGAPQINEHWCSGGHYRHGPSEPWNSERPPGSWDSERSPTDAPG